MKRRNAHSADRQAEALEQVRQWFVARGWTPFDFQYEAWDGHLSGKSGLIHTPTGVGKTYAAWFGPLLAWLAESGNDAEATPGGASNLPIRVLWVTPLRALAADLHGALRQTVEDLVLPWSVESRTGDTKTAVKSRQKETLPCFCFGKTRALLPAFGSFTGSKVIRPAAGDHVFAVAGEEIVRIGGPGSLRSA